jgi:hypothetical protein
MGISVKLNRRLIVKIRAAVLVIAVIVFLAGCAAQPENGLVVSGCQKSACCQRRRSEGCYGW